MKGDRAMVLLGGLLLMAWTFPALAQEPPAAAPTEPSPAAEDSSPAESAAEAEPETDEVPSSVPARLDVEIDLEQITVGDRVAAEITLVWMGEEPSAPPRFPTWQSTWGRAEILASSEIDAQVDSSGRRIYRQTLTLTAFEVGTVLLPEITVAVPLAERTEVISSGNSPELEVVSVLPELDDESESADEASDPSAAATPSSASDLEARPPAPLIHRPPQAAFYWSTGVLAALTLLMAAALVRRLQGVDPLAAASRRPLLPPLDELVSTLRGIDPAVGSEPAHTELSLALRRYLGRALDFQAVEGTTSEIQKRLRSTSVPAASTQRAVRLLRDCDQVKFARQEVDERVTDDRIRLAETLAREVEEQLRPAPQEPSETTDGAAAASSEAAAR